MMDRGKDAANSLRPEDLQGYVDSVAPSVEPTSRERSLGGLPKLYDAEDREDQQDQNDSPEAAADIGAAIVIAASAAQQQEDDQY
jgi:hypothetical protein